MALKKRNFHDDEVAIFDDAVVYKRGDYWQFRMWLAKEHKYARFSLKTKSKTTAIDKAKLHYHEMMVLQMQGKAYFSITTKEGVERYLKHRLKDVEAGTIVKGRHATIKTHLDHWLDFIKRDTKLKELQRTDCEYYFNDRRKPKKNISISQTTVLNEQSSINAMMSWLYKNGLTYIDSFEFAKQPRIDRGLEANRRSTFLDEEIEDIKKALAEYIKEAETDLHHGENRTKAITGYYLGFSMISGLRRGEQMQLRWCDVFDMEHFEGRKRRLDLVHVTVRGKTSKTKNTRKLVVKDFGYYHGMLKLRQRLFPEEVLERDVRDLMGEQFMFSVNGKSPVTPRAIAYHFEKLLERAGIRRTKERDLVPYSFRHYFITQRVNSNLPIASVAEMCGTSITQIERTYYHTSEAKMVSNALAEYDLVNGVYIPK